MARKEKILPEIQRAFNPATGHDISTILGPVDEEMVFIIQETGASKEEVLQAFTWLNDDDYIGARPKRPMNSRVCAVYEILQEAQDTGDKR
ncbi:MAG: hypothetical protein HY052_00110 [Proteobacteria bacterium]|nr:hypothetical protein [Pseudomonadota bacterium]